MAYQEEMGELPDLFYKDGMVPLNHDAMIKVRDGITFAASAGYSVL